VRYDGPLQRTARIPSTDVTIGGRIIAKSAMVMPFFSPGPRMQGQIAIRHARWLPKLALDVDKPE